MVKKSLARQVKQYPLVFAGIIIFSVFGAGAVVSEYWAAAHIINDVFLKQDMHALPYWFSIGLISLVLRVVFGMGADFFAVRLSAEIRFSLRKSMMKKLYAESPLQSQGESIGKMMGVFLEGIDVLDRYYRSYLPQLVKALLLPLIYLIFIFPKDWISGAVFLLTLPLIPCFMILIGRWNRKNSERQWLQLKDLASYLQDVLRGLETLKILGRSKHQGQQIYRISERYRQTTLQVQRWAFLSSMVLELMSTLSIAVVAVGLGLRLVEGNIPYVAAFFILLIAPEYYQPMRELGSFFHASMDADAVADDLMQWTSASSEGIIPAKEMSFKSLRFENVSYRYPGTDAWAVRNVSFTCEAGESVALLGPSGGGKTTLMYLALGFLAPTEGRILINEVLEPYNHPEWQHQIAYMPQEPVVFQGTVADNVSFFEDGPNAIRLERAMKKSALTELWRKEDILNMEVGSGANPLSGGQKALLSLARIFYREAQFVFLDEPTDNLDLLSEQHVVHAMDQLLSKTSSMTIAHRWHTVERADKVLFLQEGQLLAAGSFQSLLQTNAMFARFVRREHHE